MHREQSHGLVVWSFLSGRTKYKPIDIVESWLKDPAGIPTNKSPEYADRNGYSLQKPYIEFRCARPALTSMAIQLCAGLLLKEMRSAVQGSSGLQGSRVGLRGHMELALDDVGLQMIQTVRSIIQKRQPHTLELLIKLATPEPRKENGVLVVRKTRPPELVSNCQIALWIQCIEKALARG